MSTWTFNLLGEFLILAPDGAKVVLPGRKHQALTAFLVSSPLGSVSRTDAMELLWGARSEGQARASLRGVLSELKGAFTAHADAPLAADRHRIQLTGAPLAVDVHRLHDASSATSVDALQRAANLYSGDFLATLRIRERTFDEWREREGFRIRKTYTRILVNLLSALWETDAPAEHIEAVANRLLALNAADEDAHRALMLLYARQGSSLLAFEQFDTCVRQLRRIGVAPALETIELLESVRATAKPEHPPPEAYDDRAGPPAALAQRSEPFGTLIAVTPFSSAADDLEADTLGTLLAQEVIGAATRFKWFRIAPLSASFATAEGPLGVAEATGARYVLDGQLARASGGFSLFVELIDCSNHKTVWTETLGVPAAPSGDREVVVARLAAQLVEHLLTTEIAQAHQKHRDELSSYECTLLAVSNMYGLRRSNYEDAERLFALAVRRKPDHSTVYSFWALWKIWCFGQGWAEDSGEPLAGAGRLARKALERDPSDSLALAISGHFESFCNKDFEQAELLFERSLEHNPYSAFAWMLSSATYSYWGDPEEAIRRLDHADRLGSIGPHLEFMYSTARCLAYLFSQDFEQARVWGRRTVGLNDEFTNGYKQLLIALGQLDREDECDRYLRRLLELDPQFNVRSFIRQYPIARDADRRAFEDGLVKAGVPLDAPPRKTRRPSLAVVERG